MWVNFADNMGSELGNIEIHVILGKKEVYLGSDPNTGIKGGELSRNRETRYTKLQHRNVGKSN